MNDKNQKQSVYVSHAADDLQADMPALYEELERRLGALSKRLKKPEIFIAVLDNEPDFERPIFLCIEGEFSTLAQAINKGVRKGIFARMKYEKYEAEEVSEAGSEGRFVFDITDNESYIVIEKQESQNTTLKLLQRYDVEEAFGRALSLKMAEEAIMAAQAARNKTEQEDAAKKRRRVEQKARKARTAQKKITLDRMLLGGSIEMTISHSMFFLELVSSIALELDEPVQSDVLDFLKQIGKRESLADIYRVFYRRDVEIVVSVDGGRGGREYIFSQNLEKRK